MISVEEALARITSAIARLGSETIDLAQAARRVLAEDVFARFDQPPFPVSAMDGYAVRNADVQQAPVALEVIGGAPAGHPFTGTVSANQAVRIFTGSVVPQGADAIVIQEDTDQGHSVVTVRVPARAGQHIRPAGLDFKRGEQLAGAGTVLCARHLALLAAGDVANVVVRRRPRVLLAATGDELSMPGGLRKTGRIVASSLFSVAALIEQWGGTPDNAGILPDRLESIAGLAERGRDADLIVTLGGASVGEHDLIQRALAPHGFHLSFWKVAMRPGKPLIFGRLGNTPLLGLPGNPVSSYVCALLFVKPALRAMLGVAGTESAVPVRLLGSLPPNDSRQDYLRARKVEQDGEHWAEPFSAQDSSMQRVLAQADLLLVRPPHAPAAKTGDWLPSLPLE